MFCTARLVSGRSKTIFWHESSANEPGGTACFGRAREPGAASITAMSVVGGLALFNLPPAGRGQPGGACDNAADPPAGSGPALLRLAPYCSLVGNTRRPVQP